MDFQSFKHKFQKEQVQENRNNVGSDLLVSVCVQTYQHKDFIRECLDGILIQQTSFPFEILLGDDESNDGTREICLEYAQKYPEKIRLFLHHRENNIKINKSATGRFNFMYNLYSARGKYIALCEGDDYWTDPLKLQKQVDFLKKNQDFGICFHNVIVDNVLTLQENILPNVKQNSIFTIEDYILNNKTATCSMFFLREKLIIPSWLCELPFADLALTLLVLKKANSKAKVLKDIMGVYRIHGGGIHGSFHKNKKGLIKAYQQHLLFTKIISRNLFSEKKYRKVLLQKFFNTHLVLAALYKDCHKEFLFLKSGIKKNYYRFLLRIN